MSSFMELLAVIRYYLVHLVVRKTQGVWWTLSGVRRALHRAESEDGFDQCVHVSDVLGGDKLETDRYTDIPRGTQRQTGKETEGKIRKKVDGRATEFVHRALQIPEYDYDCKR
ncbi:hypothetical protein ElyMa_004055000 [Elysia marginata]|uniref:Uncharacterized protein n=1 Tax=Elysia marginata TaxID=1093978 RepID=A0AAV4G772_9GAST|nr:hypothetical protein ElyMa_004055000 [Elysia marginata]